MHNEFRRPLRVWLLPEEGYGQAAAVLCVFFLLGGILGCFAAGFCCSAEAEMTAWLSGYRTAAAQRPLLPQLWRTLRFPLLALLVSPTPLGLVGIPLLVGAKGFLVAFTSGAFYMTYGTHGIVLSLLFFGLAELFQVCGLFLLAAQGWKRSKSALCDSRFPREQERRRKKQETLVFLVVSCALLAIGFLLSVVNLVQPLLDSNFLS